MTARCDAERLYARSLTRLAQTVFPQFPEKYQPMSHTRCRTTLEDAVKALVEDCTTKAGLSTRFVGEMLNDVIDPLRKFVSAQKLQLRQLETTFSRVELTYLTRRGPT